MESLENRSRSSATGDVTLRDNQSAPAIEAATAKAKNLRGSARKARMVLELIRGKRVNDAKQILLFSNKRASHKIEKILNSAIANLTEKEGKADLENYIVSKALADDGPIMRRYMPRAQGRATVVRKRTCHITLGLSPASEKKVTAKKPSIDEAKKEIPQPSKTADLKKESDKEN